jgi:septal ring factor EnvC (AmiA/AmiB activator)
MEHAAPLSLNFDQLMGLGVFLCAALSGLFAFLFQVKGKLGEISSEIKTQTAKATAIDASLVTQKVDTAVLKESIDNQKTSIAAIHRRIDELVDSSKKSESSIHQRLDTVIDEHGTELLELRAALNAHDIPVPTLANGRGHG